ncbi:hypothetical protein [Propionispora vibrioides]|uniref:Uncharacterized protein n=1 Tax=Propionispora vibrioides TaxID=112903 RepID=A0A1H8ULK9_9FIRM|nr:hypothetical protein [Propionispora vibrioides]SEP04105.1 hypothetical protein SAMN04490178_10933 [Propionispora vibrioides]
MEAIAFVAGIVVLIIVAQITEDVSHRQLQQQFWRNNYNHTKRNSSESQRMFAVEMINCSKNRKN